MFEYGLRNRGTGLGGYQSSVGKKALLGAVAGTARCTTQYLWYNAAHDSKQGGDYAQICAVGDYFGGLNGLRRGGDQSRAITLTWHPADEDACRGDGQFGTTPYG